MYVCICTHFFRNCVRRSEQTFGRMREANKNKAQTPAYASTHPTDDERIAKQTEWMDSAQQVCACVPPHHAVNPAELR